MKHFYLFILLIFISSCDNKTQNNILLDVGIPLKMATFRSQQISNVKYNLEFSIPKIITEPIASLLDINLVINNTSRPLYLDFNENPNHIKSISVNNKDIKIDHRKQHLIINEKYLEKGNNTISITFQAGEISLNRNEDFLYTLLVPDRASTLFPCFDQPDIKAKYTLSITAPKNWKVLAGSPKINTIENNDFLTHRFQESDLMSTYLFSFVAGVFKTSSNENKEFPISMLYRENDSDKISESTTSIFNLHTKSIHFLEDYTNYKFPFKKLDLAAIPIFQYGGMEHVGAIQYREASLFLDKSATVTQKLNRGKLIAHETAHMWFGDLVTMKWFDDVWMKEVFANFMADKIINPIFKETNHDLLFLKTHYPSAYSEDRTKGTNPIKQPLDNLKNAGSLYGRIIYNKAPIMMRQLETIMGKTAFQNGIKKYIKQFANSNADWSELVELLDEETPVDVKKWSSVWVNSSGRALISDSISYKDNLISEFIIKQEAEDGSDKLWPQTFSLGLVYKDSIHSIPVNLKGKTTKISSSIGLEKPLTICYNYNGLGYGVFPIDKTMQASITKLNSPLARASSYINLYENTLTGLISPNDALQTFMSGIDLEKNEHVLSLISNYIKTLFWTFSTSKEQQENQKILEQSLLKRLDSNDNSNIKKTLFRLFKSIAYSKSGLQKLYQIWNKKIDYKQLILNKDDYSSLAQTLALYKHPQSENILNIAEKAITNPDKKKRFQFLRPALSQNDSIRNSLFISFKDSKNREKESWVENANNIIHHPIHNQSALKTLHLSLELLDEIQRTGDIFFPKGWLASTIGNYNSKDALDLLNAFLKTNPDFNPILKKKIFQTTDNLVRAQKILKD